MVSEDGVSKAGFDGKRFFVPGHRGEASFADLMKWQFGGGRAKWPKRVANTSYPAPQPRVHDKELHATWIGHSAMLLQVAGINILTDPFLSERASPLAFAGPRRVRPPALTADTLPHIDVIVLSHNHYDHMDLPALRQLARHHKTRIVTPLGNGAYIRTAVNGLAIDELNWSEHVSFDGIRITLTPALHWSKRGFSDSNRALWGAFAMETQAGLVYFAGDTGFGDGSTFRAIRETFGPPRLSLLPIGAYAPRWFMKAQHMSPEDAVEAHLLLESVTSLAIHHGTVQLTNEAIDEPREKLAVALADRNIAPDRFVAPDVGQTMVVT
jgi:L-ascorbate metabolism protein UlaG (beta-lactamase superfamily)